MEKDENGTFISKGTLRLEAFSDGVFAIAITLLILEIHIPAVKENETLLQSLAHEWPSFLALLIGFFTLLVCWINHHYMFSMIHKSSSKLSLLNGFKLLVVTITPFATALLAQNIQTAWFESSVNLYGFNFALMGLAMTGIWLYAQGNGMTQTQSVNHLIAVNKLYVFASILSITICLVSFISIIGSMILFGVMFMVFVFPEKVVAWQVARSARKELMPKEEVATIETD